MAARRAAAALLLGAGSVGALPSWSWDTIQTYVHCANFSGEWNAGALQVLAKQPFVVFEKYHKAFEEPAFDAAEAKIAESCRKVKAINPQTQCYIYTESDWARTEYSLGHWFEAHNESALRCASANNLEGLFPYTNDTVCPEDKEGCVQRQYLAYDFNNSDAREMWIERVTNVTATGHVDGAFIDGNRGGWGSNVVGSCSAEKKAGWAAGLELAVRTLATRLGANGTLISNYPTPEALKLCVGGMMERGGDSQSIEAFGKKTCGLFGQPCLLDYHAQYFREPSDGKMASFLLGVQKYGYFGGGSGWGGPGDNACALWLQQFPEFTKPLGEPKSDMVNATAPWPGAVCRAGPRRGKNPAVTTGCLWTRVFGRSVRPAQHRSRTQTWSDSVLHV